MRVASCLISRTYSQRAGSTLLLEIIPSSRADLAYLRAEILVESHLLRHRCRLAYSWTISCPFPPSQPSRSDVPRPRCMKERRVHGCVRAVAKDTMESQQRRREIKIQRGGFARISGNQGWVGSPDVAREPPDFFFSCFEKCILGALRIEVETLGTETKIRPLLSAEVIARTPQGVGTARARERERERGERERETRPDQTSKRTSPA